jgi:hypothetical protein
MLANMPRSVGVSLTGVNSALAVRPSPFGPRRSALAAKRLPRSPRQVLQMLALQAAAALAPVYFVQL